MRVRGRASWHPAGRRRGRSRLFFDGRCWEEPFSNLDYGSASVTELAQRRVLRQYGALMSEAAWLSEQDVAEVSSLNNSKVMRARLALELLSDFSESEG